MLSKRLLFPIVILGLLTFCQKASSYLPESIEGYKLSRTLTGEEAKQFINKLHFKQVAPTTNSIGFYESGSKQAVIYVTLYEKPEQAEQDWEKMTKKISSENSVFRYGTVLTIKDRSIYRCYGMGKTHYVFTHQRALIWLTAETIGAQGFLETYLNDLK
ncbi:MAG: hypothetical protein GXO77_02730 [Calditrichaeota bacterium]|nr:hypothetical protein [Calditrichota bacterium]